MHITPVDGLPLLRLSKPRFTGVSRALKAAMDRSVAGFLLLLIAPVFIAVAIAVRADGGPVFFKQERVGSNGRTFRMVKFRSMVVDAEARLAELAEANEGAGPLFKMTHDPRITKIGTLLRKYSLDELPQLLNVVGGSMSLVGPRPPLPAEVATYEDAARRRLLVRPGMTGLWQVSGRSNLSWEESVRLDLRYVENWSMALDFTILWKTVGAVIKSRGAC
jgi:exopolysaccharide biosynthesis polyprenyl glycosylphosphotransferase